MPSTPPSHPSIHPPTWEACGCSRTNCRRLHRDIKVSQPGKASLLLLLLLLLRWQRRLPQHLMVTLSSSGWQHSRRCHEEPSRRIALVVLQLLGDGLSC